MKRITELNNIDPILLYLSYNIFNASYFDFKQNEVFDVSFLSIPKKQLLNFGWNKFINDWFFKNKLESKILHPFKNNNHKKNSKIFLKQCYESGTGWFFFFYFNYFINMFIYFFSYQGLADNQICPVMLDVFICFCF